jgi:putative ABC transport system permease protein
MSFWESIRVALVALMANKLRSFLTMLGVIIGVSAVMIMISFVQGSRQQVVKEFQGDGANLLFAFYAPKRERQKVGTFDGLKMTDVQAIRRRVGSVSDISPSLEQAGKSIRNGKEFNVTSVGCLPDLLGVTSIKVAEGRFLTMEDGETWNKVCVIGDKVRKELFGKENPLGQEIELIISGQRVPLLVVGYLEYKGKGAFGQPSPDEQVLLPLVTLQKRFLGSESVGGITARAVPGVDPETAADEVFAVLKQMHPDGIRDIVVDTQEGLLQRLDSVLLLFQVILGGVGGLSLLVGGIGIMNIMLVSVTERTREIGIRKAVGAKRRDILLQFVTESMTVSGLGGLIGVGLGYAAAYAIGSVDPERLKTFVPAWAAIMGFSFAVAVGMFFGIYPAVRASRLDPIDALRYE